LAGVNACKGGWVAAATRGDVEHAYLLFVSRLDDLFAGHGVTFAVADVPMGLTSGPEPRSVEAAMRAFLPGKASSVFSTPCRQALGAESYEEACEINERHLGRRLSVQAYALFERIREADATARTRGQQLLREGHSEVSYAAMAGAPLQTKKKSREGREDRRLLLEKRGMPAADLLAERWRGTCSKENVLDAAALLWTAARVVRGNHRTFPSDPEFDETGLGMSVVA
jgi:predicted RNase H-like nuclease